MADKDEYGDWLEGFRREVDDALGARVPPPPAPPPGPQDPPEPKAVDAMKRAVSEFEDWWRQETSDPGAEPDVDLEAEQVNKELELSRREARSLRAELDKLRQDPSAPGRQAAGEERRQEALERQRLFIRCGELERDNEALRRRETEALERLAQFKVEAERAKDAYDARVQRLEDDLKRLEAQAETLSEDRAFLRAEFTRQSARLEGAEKELKETARRAESLAESSRELTARAEAERARTHELERRAAALQGEVEALRAQSAALQDRLVRVAAPDPAEASRAGMEELRRREAALTEAFDARQKRLEERLREATAWLETKLREAGGAA